LKHDQAGTTDVKVVITGGAGFIGSHLATRLLQGGHSVVIADNLSSGRVENVPSGAHFVYADVSHPDGAEQLPRDVNVVCHLAAQSAGARSAQRPYYDLQTNAGSTLLLTRWCLKHGIPRFVYASSMAVYGNVDVSPVREETPCIPTAYYGISKLTSEHLLRLAAREGLKVTTFRIFTSYGPGQDLDNLEQGMVSIYLAYMLRGVPVPVTGRLDRFRDIIYIDDVVNAWEKAVELPETPSQVYNLGSGKPTTVRELLAVLKDALGLPPDYPVEELAGSPSDQFGLYADISSVKSDLGFTPRVDLATGVKRMAAWARSRMGTETSRP
jgi:UDP-glucose 4-epimerase